MTSDGKAVVRAGAEPSPSKNRVSMFPSRSSRPPGLRRCSSEFGGLRTKSTFGRSRDPRNWGSSFDTDARSALLTRSERPRVSRSFSDRKSLRPTTNIANAPQESGGRKKRKLSISELGKLVFESAQSTLGGKKAGQDVHHAGDSDKENWIPDIRNPGRMHMGSTRQGGANRMSDVSAFMGGDGNANEAEDLDCIQGLLSLSQGAWR